MKVAAYQAPLLPSGCQEAVDLIRARVEWCESRGDCTYAVVCPGCSLQFLVSDEDLDELRVWTDVEGNRLVCGVQWD